MSRLLLLVDGLAMQLYFACRASKEGNRQNEAELTQEQLRRYWREAAPLLRRLVDEPHPHTAHQMVQTFQHLLPCSPGEVFLLAAKSIQNSASQARFQYESLAVGEVVQLIQRALADYREIFRDDGAQNECLKALLDVLDLFVEAGWAEARQLTHRLEEIYR
jgi:AcrR family transcriptional regulator